MNVQDLVAQTFDEGALLSCQDGCPQGPHGRFVCASNRGTIGTAPNEGATSARSLTNPSPESAKTRGIRMATNDNTARRTYQHHGDWKRSRKSTEEERFWEKVDKSGECWIWLAAKNGPGYGIFGSAVERLAYRWSYRDAFGPIPAGHEIDHLCRVVSCVNPSHLEAVTKAENTRRKMLAMRAAEACKRGHEWTEQNTYWMKNGSRQCKECRRQKARQRHKDTANRRAPIDFGGVA